MLPPSLFLLSIPLSISPSISTQNGGVDVWFDGGGRIWLVDGAATAVDLVSRGGSRVWEMAAAVL